MFKPVVGYEGCYEVSDAGDVRNARTGHVLRPQRCTNGYVSQQLGRGSRRLVHRLVAAAFVPGDNTLQVNHKNGVRDDNRAENLEWLTCSDNHRHSYRELTRKRHGKTKPVALVVDGALAAMCYPSGLAAAKALGVCPGSIMSALHRGHKCRGAEVFHV